MRASSVKSCRHCGEACDRDGHGHGNFRDRGDGFCSRCGRTLSWHAGTSCFCALSTGMPAPIAIDRQLRFEVPSPLLNRRAERSA